VEETARQEIFVLDRFGYAKLLDPQLFEKNRETVERENVWVIPCTTAEKIGLVTDQGVLHMVRVTDIPNGKVKDKGTPIDNISRFDGMKERPVCVDNMTRFVGKRLLFVTAGGMVKIVPGSEFITVNRNTIAATKLADGDSLVAVLDTASAEDAVLATKNGYFLRFPLKEISVMKKNSRGVCGIRLTSGDSVLSAWVAPEAAPASVTYRDREIDLGTIRTAKRDGRGSKIKE
jgi:DNA gyrase subunit A